MRWSGGRNEHHVQDTVVLLPTGTIDRGTPKHDSVGTVLSGSIAHLIRCSPAGEAACIPCPEEAGPSAPAREVTLPLAEARGLSAGRQDAERRAGCPPGPACVRTGGPPTGDWRGP